MGYNARLCFLREKIGLNQVEMGKYLGIPQVTYSNYETGIRKIPPKILEKLSRYGVDTEWLLFGKTAADRCRHFREFFTINSALKSELAAKAGVPEAFLQAIVESEVSPSSEFVERFWKIAGVENPEPDGRSLNGPMFMIREKPAPYSTDRLAALENKFSEFSTDMGLVKELLLDIKNDIEKHKGAMPGCFGVEKKNHTVPGRDPG